MSLIDLAKQKFTVEFSEKECKTIFEEAKNLLKATNGCISRNSFFAIPTETNCKSCLYRPACSFFQRKLETDFSRNDVSGEIRDVKEFLNGNVSIFLQNGERQLIIKNFSPEKYEELNVSRNKKINIYNLRKEVVDFAYSTTETTMIYE